MSLPQRKVRKTESVRDLDPSDLEWLKTRAVYLKATGLSYRKISDVLRVTTSIVKTWFQDEEMHKRVEVLREDTIQGAISFISDAQIELAHLLLSVARDPERGSDQLKAILEGLGMGGITKVNKSESKTTSETKETHELSPEMFERLEGLPLDTQKKLAEMAGEMSGLLEDAKGTE